MGAPVWSFCPINPREKGYRYMKRIISLILLICTLTLTLGGCGFFDEEGGMMISEIKKTNEFEDGTSELTIYFTDEYIDPVKITIPAGKEGEVGNGIADIKYEYNEEGKQTHLTIEFTKEGVKPIEFDIPDGKTITSITTDYNATLERYEAYFIFNGNAEDFVTMPLPEFSGIKSYEVVTNEDKSVDITFTFNIIEEPLKIHVPAPEKGNGIANIVSYEDETKYYLDITYTDPDTPVQTVDFNKPKEPSGWTAYNGAPDSKPGVEPAKVGDFWFDTGLKIIYVRGELGWERIIAFNDETSDPHEILFYWNDGSTKVYSQAYVNHGKYFSSTGKDIPIPTREGYEFRGWYTKAEITNEYVMVPFTDLTPVTDDIKLYAIWAEITE